MPSSRHVDSMGTTVPQALAQKEYAHPSAADPADFTAVELLAAYRAKRLSPVEAMQAGVDPGQGREPEIRALYALRPRCGPSATRGSPGRWGRYTVCPPAGASPRRPGKGA